MQIGVRNLRRLRQVGPIEIKPITLLVGRNSSGKSSFLRMLPLLRQSLLTRVSSPILWYGDMVDFGSYSTAVSHATKDQGVGFTFVLDRVNPELDFPFLRRRRYQTKSEGYSNVSLSVDILPDDANEFGTIRTYVSRLHLRSSSPHTDVVMEMNRRGDVKRLLFSGVNVADLINPVRLATAQGKIIPDIYARLPDASDQVHEHPDGQFSDVVDALARQLLEKFGGDSSDEQARKRHSKIAAELLQSKADTPEDIRRFSAFYKDVEWDDFVERITSDVTSDQYKHLQASIAVSTLNEILLAADFHLRAIFKETLYIGPARARSERYYRFQDLAVSEIDPDGKNFPMFLNSLSRRKLEDFSNWIEGLFGYGVEADRSGGHISIYLTSRGTRSNIVDTGYGVSQILPVLAQIWWARRHVRHEWVRTPAMLAIEQPELHLHPAHQALLADALVGEVSLRAKNQVGSIKDVRFVVETHSETLVNRLGVLIDRGKIDHKDVQILIFDPDGEDESSTSVRVSLFNPSGQLLDWPYGFFQAGFD